MRLGPFHLEEPLGRGGMGEVWRGRHVAQGVPVAVKVIVAELANNERFRTAFADEVRAVARLNHPSIVAVYDHGVIDEAAAAASGDKLVAGSPYLVMELCKGTSMRGVTTLESFAELRLILLQLLDALAHAHARGVIHRDIKPSNMMLTIDDAGDHRLKLTDFGIARAARDEPHLDHGTSSGTGTPGYMAPEQIVGDMQAQGPWTDLYAVGCLAFRLATGNVPYATAGDDQAVLAAHLRDPVPPLSAAFPVPAGFQPWLERLLHKAAYRRFLRAADAIWALLGLGDAPRVSEQPDDDDRITEHDPIPAVERTLTTMAFVDDELLADDTTVQDPATSPIASAGDAPPIPSSFQRSARPARGHLLGAGLGLFGLRPTPFVGRTSERSLIWSQLRDTAAGAGPQLALLHGPAGNGKSRLAEWITQRTHELGSAHVMRASHGATPGPAHGLAPMLARYFDCFALERDGVMQQLRAMLGDGNAVSHLVLSLTELIAPSTAPAGEQRVRFASMEERYATVAQLLMHLSASRPVVMWLDDVQWGADALGLVEYLLERQRALRALFLITMRDEGPAERSLTSGRLKRLMSHRAARSIEVGPLSPEDHRDLVHKLLGLEGELARQVEARTAGNPLFAVQLVGDWVRRGVLQAGDDGFTLRPGERAELPDDLYALWTRRIDQLVSSFFDQASARQTLEIAAALGDHVHEQEWREVCARCAVPIPPLLVDRVLESGLGRRRDLGWSFCHGMLREALLRGADRRAARHHHACVAMLEHRYPHAHDLAARVGHHLVAAGAHREALAPLLEAARRRYERGDFEQARSLLAQREAALASSGAAHGDSRYVEGWLLAARTCIGQLDFEGADAWLNRCDEHGVDELQVAHTCLLHAELYWHHGQMKEAIALARATRQLFAALEQWLLAADCRIIIAKCLLEGTGDARAALIEAEAARDHYQDAGDADRLADCAYLESTIYLALGQDDQAEQMALAAERHHHSQGHRWGIAKCVNQLGEIARVRGELEQAEAHYLRCTELLEEMGTDSSGPRLNLALVQVGRARYALALPALRRLRSEASDAGLERALGHIDYALLTCCGAEKEWAAFDAQLERAAQWVPERGRVDPDYAALAEKAAGFASMVRDVDRACAALALGVAHWRALGKADKADALEARIAALRQR